jgi:hypothetical protein
VEEGDGGDGMREVASAPTMIAEDPPVLEAGDGVLDASAAPAMPTPGAIADDTIPSEDGDAKAADTAVSAVRENATMPKAQRLDGSGPGRCDSRAHPPRWR